MTTKNNKNSQHPQTPVIQIASLNVVSQNVGTPNVQSLNVLKSNIEPSNVESPNLSSLNVVSPNVPKLNGENGIKIVETGAKVEPYIESKTETKAEPKTPKVLNLDFSKIDTTSTTLSTLSKLSPIASSPTTEQNAAKYEF